MRLILLGALAISLPVMDMIVEKQIPLNQPVRYVRVK